MAHRLETQQVEHARLNRPGLAPEIPGAYAVREGQPHDVPVQINGKPKEAGKLVERTAIEFLRSEPLEIPDGQSGRLQLAQ